MRIPDTFNARTGVTDIPPALPASADTRSSAEWLASIITLPSSGTLYIEETVPPGCAAFPSEASPLCCVPSDDGISFAFRMITPSSIPAMTSTPVTATAIPAPTPTLPASSVAVVSAVVVKRSFEEADTWMSASSVKLITASFKTTAIVLLEATWTTIAPPMPISPSE